MTQEFSLTEGKISTTLLRFAPPFLLASFLQALYGAADLYVVGRFDTAAGVSAVAIGSQVMQTITGIILGISTGGTVLLGRCIDEANPRGAAKAVGTIASSFLLLAVILTPLMLFLTESIVTVMETPREAAEAAKAYIFTCSAGIPFIIGYNAVSGIFRGLGGSKIPVYFILIACVVNIGVDFLLVGGFGMGAEGAAIATVAAQAISFLAALIYIKRKGFSFPVYKRDFIPDPQSALRIWKVGLPLALQDALVNIGHHSHCEYIGAGAFGSGGCCGKNHHFCYVAAHIFCFGCCCHDGSESRSGKGGTGKKNIMVWDWICIGLWCFILHILSVEPGKYHRDICKGGRGGQCSGRLFTVLFHRLYSGCLYFLHELLFQRLWKIGNFFCSQYADNFWCAYSCHCVSEPLCRGIPLCDGSGFSLGNLCFTGDLPVFPAVSP